MGEMTKEENVGPALQDWPSRVNLLRKSLAKMSCPVACGNLMISEGRTKVCPLLSLYREMIILALTPTTFLIRSIQVARKNLTPLRTDARFYSLVFILMLKLILWSIR